MSALAAAAALAEAPPTPSASLRDVETVVCAWFEVSPVELRSARRTAAIVQPRHVFCYLACTLTPRSLPQIGAWLGGRDHTTIHHARGRIATALAVGSPLSEAIAAMRGLILDLAAARGAGVIRRDADPFEVADRVMKGGYRAACNVSVDDVRAVCAQLNDLTEARALGDNTLLLLGQAFLVAELRLGAAPASPAVRKSRDAAISDLRKTGAPMFAEFLAAHDAHLRAAYTAGERQTLDRRQCALARLEKSLEQKRMELDV
jgi:hypothetical protein